MAYVQVLPETKDNLIQDLEEPVNPHIEVEESVKTSPTTEPLVAETASVISEPVPVMLHIEVFIFYSYENKLADPVLLRKDDSTKHVNEAVVVAVGLATAEDFSSTDKEAPEVTNEATPEAGNDSVESGTTLNIEPPREHEVDVTVTEAEDTLPDIHSSLRNEPAPVSLHLEPEASLMKTELVAERQVETASTATTNSDPLDVEVQFHPSSSEAQNDNEIQTQVNDTSNIKDEPIPKSNIAEHIDAADTEGPLEDVPASSTKQSQDTVQIEPEINFVAPAEEEPSAITQVAAAIAEGSPEIVFNPNATSGIEHQSEPEQETLTVLSPSTQESGVDVVSSSKDAPTVDVAHEVETEVEAETHGTDAATATNDLSAAELPETERPVKPTTEVFIIHSCGNTLADQVLPRKADSTRQVNEAVIVALGLVTAEELSSMDKVVPKVAHEAMPEVGNDSVDSGTEPQRELEVDVTVPETEDTLSDTYSSLRNDPTPVSLPLEPGASLIKRGLVAERQVETTSTVTTDNAPIDVEIQSDPSFSGTAPNTQEDIETQVDDSFNILDEPIPKSDIAQHIEVADTDGPLEDAPDQSSSTKQSQDTAQTEPEVDFVAPAEEEPSAVTQVAAENLLPKTENESAISQTPGETIPIPEDATTSVANVEDQIIAPVNVRSETSCTDELAEVIRSPDVEESFDTLTPLVEPSYKSSNEMVGVSVLPISNHPRIKINTLKSHVPIVDVPETQDFGEAALVPIMAAASIESDQGREAAENMSVISQELPVNSEPEEPATHKEAVHISSTSHEIPQVNVPVTLETEPEPRPTNSTSEDKASALEVEEQVPESHDAASIELNDEIISPPAAEPGPEVVAAVVAPAVGTSELQAQHSVEESTEVSFTPILSAGSLVNCNKFIKDHIVEAASETEFIAPNEGRLRSAMEVPTDFHLESTAEPVEAQLEIPEAKESDRTAEVEPQIIPAVMEESPGQIEEDRPVLAALQVGQL